MLFRPVQRRFVSSGRKPPGRFNGSLLFVLHGYVAKYRRFFAILAILAVSPTPSPTSTPKNKDLQDSTPGMSLLIPGLRSHNPSPLSADLEVMPKSINYSK